MKGLCGSMGDMQFGEKFQPYVNRQRRRFHLDCLPRFQGYMSAVGLSQLYLGEDLPPGCSVSDVQSLPYLVGNGAWSQDPAYTLFAIIGGNPLV
jgi:hypothetical protein